MSKKLQLHIPTPCHENWDAMTPVEQGRFCGSCQKKVVDFSEMSDQQLVEFFKQPSTGSVCGRFMNDQLERDIALPKKRIPWLRYFFTITIPAFLLSMKASAQADRRTKGKVAVQSEKLLNSLKSNKKIIKDTLPVIVPTQVVMGAVSYISLEELYARKAIMAKVVDEKGDAIPFASIRIKERPVGMAADANGVFTIQKKNEDSLSVIVSAVNCMPVEKTFSTIEKDTIIIELKRNDVMKEVVITADVSHYLGRVAGGLSIVRKITRSEAVVKNIFYPDSIKLYPNPIKAGNTINLEILRSGSGKIEIDVFDISGKKVHTTFLNMNTKSWKASLPMPSLTPGTYFVRVYADDAKKTFTQKIIVQ